MLAQSVLGNSISLLAPNDVQVETIVLDVLKIKPKSKASELYEIILARSYRSLECKTKIVKHLHTLVRQNKVIATDNVPPTYHIPGIEQSQMIDRKSEQSQTGLLVVIDLGNVHHVLESVEKYSGVTTNLEIKAYADRAYNHYKPHTQDILWHNPESQRETTDVKLISDTAIKLASAKIKYHVIVMSLDKVVNVRTDDQMMGHRCTLAKKWMNLEFI